MADVVNAYSKIGHIVFYCSYGGERRSLWT